MVFKRKLLVQLTMTMRLTVCELSDDAENFASDWQRLTAHVKSSASDLVLLPEMPFSPWFAWQRSFDPQVWEQVVQAHQDWETRLAELAPAAVLATRPVDSAGSRLNQGFRWQAAGGLQPVHSKHYLPDDEGFWEASWYQPAPVDFSLFQAGPAQVGMLICTELWFFQRARQYGKAGAHLIACPRATGKASRERWLVAGRAAAIVSGAFCLSSNRVNPEGRQADLGGQGWVVDPEGEVLGLTSPDSPFITVEVDLQAAETAKRTYPRYVEEET